MIVPISQSIRLISHTSSLKMFRTFVEQTVRTAELSPRLTRHVVLAVDEAVTSIIRHASANGRVGEIEVVIDVRPQMLHVVITDSGLSFDSTLGDTRELIERARSLELGVFLIRQIMDQVNYVFRKGRQNQLELVKFLPDD